MGVKTIIDSRGIVQVFVPDGEERANIDVPTGIATPQGVLPGAQNVVSASAAVPGLGGGTVWAIPGPGFVFLSGSTFTSASLPKASTYPGAMMTLYCSSSVTTANAGCQLTGSSFEGTKPVFICPFSGTLANQQYPLTTNATLQGTKCVMPPQGSLVLMSDSRFWVVVTLSGSITLS